MKRYEMIWEIFNNCSGNQMRDVHIQEVQTDDPEKYVMSRFKDDPPVCELEEAADGSLVYNVSSHGLRQRFSFTEL